MGTWYLVRHARTAWNAAGRVQGHADPPLDATGSAQAERLAARLASTPFAAAYTSDLSRSMDTARAILNGRPTSLESAPELREIAYGQWEGLTYRELQTRYPKDYALYTQGSMAFAAPGGESISQLIQRVCQLQERLVSVHAADDMLVVGHSGSLLSLLVCLLGLPPEAVWRFHADRASLSIVTLHSQRAILNLWNDTSHLEGLDGE